MAGDDGSNGLIIFRQHGHDSIGFRARGKTGEAAQIAENRDHLAPLSLQQPLIGVFNQFSHLRRKESLQAIDALGFLFGDCQLCRHLVEAVCQLLQLVAARDRDAMIELPGADPFAASTTDLSLLKSSDPALPRSTRLMSGWATRRPESSTMRAWPVSPILIAATTSQISFRLMSAMAIPADGRFPATAILMWGS